MMLIKDLGDRLGFPPEATEYLQQELTQIICVPGVPDLLADAMDGLYSMDQKEYQSKLERISEMTGVHEYTVKMIFLMMAARPLRYIYRQKGIDEEIYWDTMHDLTNKLNECKKVYGIWGTFVGEWFRDYYHCLRFHLGRLQFEVRHYDRGCYRGIIRNGDPVLNCHIPSCGPLKEEDVYDSFRKAMKFFPEVVKDGILPVVCHSWLLYRPQYEVFPEGGNLRRFYDMFDVIFSESSPKNHNFWRIFNQKEVDLKTAPTDTTLQRRLKAFMEAGHDMGTGFGVILFDGEKIINKRK